MKKSLFLMSIFVIQTSKPTTEYVQPERWDTDKMLELHFKHWAKDEKIKSILLATCGTRLILPMFISEYSTTNEFKKTCPIIQEFFEISIDKLMHHYENQENRQKQIDRLQKELIDEQNNFFLSFNQYIQQVHEISTSTNQDEVADKLAAFVQTVQNSQEVEQAEDRYNTTDGTH